MELTRALIADLELTYRPTRPRGDLEHGARARALLRSRRHRAHRASAAARPLRTA